MTIAEEAWELFKELDKTRVGQGAVISKALQKAEDRGYLRGLKEAKSVFTGKKEVPSE